MRIEAPFPIIEVSSNLPSPVFGNSFSIGTFVNKKITINNTRRTYVKFKDMYKLNFVLVLPILKTHELRNLIEQYIDDYFLITDHLEERWVAKWTGPDDFPIIWKTRDGRAEVNLEFQGRKLT